ncbi:hypothetical protein Z043_111188, partial [Scleropages formosus]
LCFGLWEATTSKVRTITKQYCVRRKAPSHRAISRVEKKSPNKGTRRRCSSFFFNEVREFRQDTSFTSLRTRHGELVKDMARMLEHLQATLPADSRSRIEAPITLRELSEVLSRTNRRKVLGLDGSPVEFYSTFWDALGPVFLEVLQEVLTRGKLAKSMRSGVLSLLQKKDDKADLGNWRPLTILCADVKLMAKTLPKHLRKVMVLLVHEDQTSGVPRRVGGKTVKLAQYTEDTTLFACSNWSLAQALHPTQMFWKASGSVLNLWKTEVKGPLRVLGVSFLSGGAAQVNWEEYLAISRQKMGLWKA